MPKMSGIAKLALGLIHETGGITSYDLQDAATIGYSTSCGVLAQMVSIGLLECVIVQHRALYAMTKKGEALYAKLPPIDENERPIYLVGHNDENS